MLGRARATVVYGNIVTFTLSGTVPVATSSHSTAISIAVRGWPVTAMSPTWVATLVGPCSGTEARALVLHVVGGGTAAEETCRHPNILPLGEKVTYRCSARYSPYYTLE